MATGRRLYREGLLASGEAASALVQGDVPVSGAQVKCRNCHGRSGMGAIESGRVPAPLAGPLLFAADAARRRPPYDESTLGRALREGIDAAGRPLDPLMPRYRLERRDVAALAAYLRRLGAESSPGVGPGTLRIATLVEGGVDAPVAEAVLDVYRAFVAERNVGATRRLRGGHAPGQWKETYREWSLDVWSLAGPPEGWRAQLESRYRDHAVFALVGGVASGSWQPVHDFCEAAEMPCLLPDADLPPPEDEAFYSFYYSRGLRLEAEIMAASLAAEGRHRAVVSVVEGDAGSAAVEAAAALARALERRGGRMRLLDASREPRPSLADASATVLWLGAGGVGRQARMLPTGDGGAPVLLSSTLLDSRWDDLPEPVRTRARVVHLTALPGEPDPSLARFRAWARARGVRVREERHQALAYFSCLAFAEAAKHTGRFVVRDYLVDQLEHASTLTAYLPLFLRAGITPGQRVLSRGGYVVDPSGGVQPVWLVP